MSDNNQPLGKQQRSTALNPNAALFVPRQQQNSFPLQVLSGPPQKLNPNADPFVPRQQQTAPVPLQILEGSPQQLNPFHMEQSNNPMQFPQQNVGPQNAPQDHQFSKLSQINSGFVKPGEML